MENIIVAIISSVTSCVVVAIPIAVQHRKERKNQITELKDGLMCSLRNDILQVYLKNKRYKRFTILEKQAVNYSHKVYKAYGGNSFVDDIVNEMNEWETI